MFKIPKIVPDQSPQKCQRPTVLGLGTSNSHLLNIANSLIVPAKRVHCFKTYSRRVGSQRWGPGSAAAPGNLTEMHILAVPKPSQSESLRGGQKTVYQALQVILMHAQI